MKPKHEHVATGFRMMHDHPELQEVFLPLLRDDLRDSFLEFSNQIGSQQPSADRSAMTITHPLLRNQISGPVSKEEAGDQKKLEELLDNKNVDVILLKPAAPGVTFRIDRKPAKHTTYVDAVEGARISAVSDGKVALYGTATVAKLNGGEVDALEDSQVSEVTDGVVMAYGNSTVNAVSGGNVTAHNIARINNVTDGIVHAYEHSTINKVSGGQVVARQEATINGVSGGQLGAYANSMVTDVTGGSVSVGENATIVLGNVEYKLDADRIVIGEKGAVSGVGDMGLPPTVTVFDAQNKKIWPRM